MTVFSRAGRPPLDQQVKSRLDQSLLRLHQAQEEDGRLGADTVENLLTAWQKKWSTRRDEISQRLQLIEKQLGRLDRAEKVPRLSVVGIPADATSATLAERC